MRYSQGPLDGSWQDGANFGGPPPGFVDSPDGGGSSYSGGIAGNYNAFWTRFFTSGESFSDYVAENGTGTTYQFGIAGNLEYVGPSYSNTDNYTQKSLFGSEVLDDGFGNKISILTYGYEHISADHADILLGSSTQGDGEANQGGQSYLSEFWQGATRPAQLNESDPGFNATLGGFSSGGISAILKPGSKVSASIAQDFKYANGVGYAVGGLSMVVTAVSDYNRPQGLTWGTRVKEGIGALEIAFPEFGLIYGGADILTGVITGKTLTDRIGDGIDNIH